MRDSYELEVLLKMTAKEWLDKNNINLFVLKQTKGGFYCSQ